MSNVEASNCEGCGASVYPEHLESGIARYMNGKLLCAHCLKDEESADSLADLVEPISFDTDDSHGTKVDLGKSKIMATEDCKPDRVRDPTRTCRG